LNFPVSCPKSYPSGVDPRFSFGGLPEILNKIDEQLSYTRGNTLLLSHFLNILNVFLRENYPSVVQDAIHVERQSFKMLSSNYKEKVVRFTFRNNEIGSKITYKTSFQPNTNVVSIDKSRKNFVARFHLEFIAGSYNVCDFPMSMRPSHLSLNFPIQ